MVHAVDAHSNKSALIPPPPIELERLAHQARLPQLDAAPAKACDGGMRSLRRRLSPQVIAELVARYDTGEDTPALSREYGMSKTGLRELHKAEGVSMRRQAITPEDAETAVRFYERGLTVQQVVERVGYSYGTIRKVLHESGVTMGSTRTKKRTAPG